MNSNSDIAASLIESEPESRRLLPLSMLIASFHKTSPGPTASPNFLARRAKINIETSNHDCWTAYIFLCRYCGHEIVHSYRRVTVKRSWKMSLDFIVCRTKYPHHTSTQEPDPWLLSPAGPHQQRPP